MKLIKLRTKVLLTSETQMELKQEHDLGTLRDEEKQWVYRNTAVIASEIYRIIQYDRTKTLVEMYGEDSYLVDEPFSKVFKKWTESKADDEFEEVDDEETKQAHSNEEDSDG